jgi:hypothetical protein
MLLGWEANGTASRSRSMESSGISSVETSDSATIELNAVIMNEK